MREFLGKMVKKCVKSSTLFQLFKKWFAACLDTCFPKERRHYFRVKGSLFLHIQQQLRSIEKIPFHKKRKRSQSLSSYNSSEVQCFSSSHFLAALLHSTMAGLVGSSEVEVRPSSSTLLPLWWQRGISKERMNKNPGSRDRQHN